MIYLDNAATTQHKPKEVIDAIVFGLSNMGNNGRGVNKISLDTSKIIFEAREKLTKFFGGEDSRRLIFTSNATDSLNIVIKGLFEEKDHIITTELEHNSVLRPLYELEENGVNLSFIKREEILNFNENIIKKYLKENTKAIICTHSSNLTGDVVNINKVGKFCKENGILFILDASQSAGILPINVENDNIDVVCFTGHKSLYGPQGIGGFYVKEGIEIKPLKSGGTGVKTFDKKQPQFLPERLEAGTLNGHGIIGLSAGIDFINKIGMENIYKKEIELMWYFYEKLKELKEIKIYGNFEVESFNNNNLNYENKNFENKIIRTPIVTINIEDIDSGELCDILNTEYGVVTRAGGHCAPLMHKSLGTEAQGAVRFSFSYFNTKEDVENTINALKDILNQL